MEEIKETVYSVTKRILIKLDALSEQPTGKAYLAKIRNSIGKSINEATDVWQILFENLPEEFLSETKKPKIEELAILTSIQMYALHKQGNDLKLYSDEDAKFKNIGYSLRKLKLDTSSVSINKRFNSMITSTTFEELSNHLRSLIKILKSKFPDMFVDYALLADDLFSYLKGYDQDVRLRWSREYYKMNSKGENNNE